jgi:P-type E1-E2 ATPase
VAIRAAHGFGEDELLAAVASAEQYSSHVLATSMIAAARDRRLPLSEAEWAREAATNGVEAEVDGRVVVVGKFAFVAEHAPDAARTAIAPGELAVYVAIDGRFAGALLASDRLRDDARSMLEELDRLGVHQTMMLTGDAQATADHIAAELGITRVRADCLPADKVQEVAGIAERPVIMVGDGVNDAPVLAAADVGIAMGAKGATAASESADAVILVDDISRTATAVRIGRDTVRIALQSIWLGIIVSVGLMIVAAFGLIPRDRRGAAAGGRRPRHHPRGAARDRRPARREGLGSCAARRPGIRSLTVATAPRSQLGNTRAECGESLHQVCS